MTLTLNIIEGAFREAGLLGEVSYPTPKQGAEALAKLQALVLSVLGNEAGEPLTPFPLGQENTHRPAGYPATPSGEWVVPKNVRILLNIGEATSLYLHPNPDDGSRFGIVDVAGNLATYPITIYGNGRLIDGAETKTVNTNSEKAEWFYRSDLGEWVECVPLVANATFPFPEEFNDYFVTMLALRLSPSYAGEFKGESKVFLDRSRSQLRSRYSQRIQKSTDFALLRTLGVPDNYDSSSVIEDSFEKGFMF